MGNRERFGQCLVVLAVGQADENQSGEHRSGDAEGGVLSVPKLGLPHRKIFAVQSRQNRKTIDKSECQPGHGPEFRVIEDFGARPQSAEQNNGAEREQ